MNITMNVDENTIATILEGMTIADVDSLVSILTNDGNSCVLISVSYLVSSIIKNQKNNKSFINLIKTIVDSYSKESDKAEPTDSASASNNTETTNDYNVPIREYYSVVELIKGCVVDTGNVYVCEHGVNNDTTYLIDNYGRFKRDIPESERASFLNEFKLKPIDNIIAFIKYNVYSMTNAIVRMYKNKGTSTFKYISDTNGEIVSVTDEDGNEVSVMNGDIIEVENGKIKLYKNAYTETGYICTEIPIDNGRLINNLIIIETYMDCEFITQAEVWDIMNNWYKKSLEQLIEPDKYYVVVNRNIKIDDVSFTIGDIISFTDDSMHVSLIGNSNKAYMYKIGCMISEDTEHKTFYPVSSYEDALMVAKLANFFSKR